MANGFCANLPERVVRIRCKASMPTTIGFHFREIEEYHPPNAERVEKIPLLDPIVKCRGTYPETACRFLHIEQLHHNPLLADYWVPLRVKNKCTISSHERLGSWLRIVHYYSVMGQVTNQKRKT